MGRVGKQRVLTATAALVLSGLGLALLLLLPRGQPAAQLQAVFNPAGAVQGLWSLRRPAAELLALALVTLPPLVLLWQWLSQKLPQNLGRKRRSKRRRHRRKPAP